MPTVKLHENDCRDPAGLPPVCMVCGKDAPDSIPRTFQYVPSWVYLGLLCGALPALILLLIARKYMKAFTPLCDEHANHFTKKVWFSNISMILGVLIGIAGFFMMAMSNDRNIANQDILFYGGIAGMVLGLVGLIAAAAANSIGICVRRISDREIVFTKVSEEFSKAYIEQEEKRKERVKQRREREDAEYAARPRKARRRDDDDDDDSDY